MTVTNKDVLMILGAFFTGLFCFAVSFLLTVFDGSGADLTTAITAFVLTLIGGSLAAFAEKRIRSARELKFSPLSFALFILTAFHFHMGAILNKAMHLTVSTGNRISYAFFGSIAVLILVYVFQNKRISGKLWSHAVVAWSAFVTLLFLMLR